MAELNEAGEVRAAGGVVWRRDLTGAVEVLLVHRPKYDDWSLPKGKADPGEDDLSCALREVAEETGLRCRVECELTEVHYHDNRDRPKVARYWMMAAVDGRFSPHDEIDEVAWMSLADANERLTYDRDVDVLDVLELVLSTPVLLIRHADAGHRSPGAGDDGLRRLSAAGQEQAQALADVLAAFSIREVRSSPAVRCAETVQPLARARGLSVETDERLAEGAGSAMSEHLAGLLDGGAALCTHGDVIPALLAAIPGPHGEEAPSASKASTWVLDGVAGRLIRASYLPLPRPTGAE